MRARLHWVELESGEGAMTLNLDGEPVQARRFRIECVPGRVRMHLPADSPLLGQPSGRLRGDGRGDLVVHVDVQTPTNLDDAQRDLLRDLAAMRGEERPRTSLASTDGGFFGRLRGAFKGR